MYRFLIVKLCFRMYIVQFNKILGCSALVLKQMYDMQGPCACAHINSNVDLSPLQIPDTYCNVLHKNNDKNKLYKIQ